jgi:hypothetical protein
MLFHLAYIYIYLCKQQTNMEPSVTRKIAGIRKNRCCRSAALHVEVTPTIFHFLSKKRTQQIGFTSISVQDRLCGLVLRASG